MPDILKLTDTNGTEQLIERTAEIWSQGNNTVAIDIDNIKNLKSLKLITTHYPDSDKTNNGLEIKLQLTLVTVAQAFKKDKNYMKSSFLSDFSFLIPEQ